MSRKKHAPKKTKQELEDLKRRRKPPMPCFRITDSKAVRDEKHLRREQQLFKKGEYE